MNTKIEEYVQHCLNCPTKPCSNIGCPLHNDIPTFIKQVKEGNINEAYKTLLNTTVLGSICGRICPHQKQCQGKCVRGIKGEPVHIGEIEAYVFDEALKNKWYKEVEKSRELEGKKVAVIGSGPASLTCSAFLARSGADVTIFEKYNTLGGILRRGIPKFRLEELILNNTIEQILFWGVKTKFQQELGKNISLDILKNNYDAVFLGIGANIPVKMNIPGEDLKGVFGGNTILETDKHPDYTGKKVAVIGGGNVAMDCARTIKHMGAEEVSIIYRRAEEQMPAEEKEISDAKNEGINFLFQNNITKIIGSGEVEAIECIKTELVEKEGETRKVPMDIEGSNYQIPMDYVVMAVGSKPDINNTQQMGLQLTEKGYIKVNEKYQTSDEKIYAGGDIIGQKATVAWAAMSGREAANSIKVMLVKN